MTNERNLNLSSPTLASMFLTTTLCLLPLRLLIISKLDQNLGLRTHLCGMIVGPGSCQYSSDLLNLKSNLASEKTTDHKTSKKDCPKFFFIYVALKYLMQSICNLWNSWPFAKTIYSLNRHLLSIYYVKLLRIQCEVIFAFAIYLSIGQGKFKHINKQLKCCLSMIGGIYKILLQQGIKIILHMDNGNQCRVGVRLRTSIWISCVLELKS